MFLAARMWAQALGAWRLAIRKSSSRRGWKELEKRWKDGGEGANNHKHTSIDKAWMFQVQVTPPPPATPSNIQNRIWAKEDA